MQLLRLPASRRPGARRVASRTVRSLAVAAAVVATCAPAWAGSSPPPAAGLVVPGRVTASLSACHTAGDLASRYATFAAQMTSTPTSVGMALRLALYEHTPGTPGYRLRTGVPGFGVWEHSAPGVSVFNYNQEVTNLVAPASFRVQVAYRWLDANRHVIKRANRTTDSCVQPPQLANLVAGALSITPGAAPDTATYDLNVRNDGGVAAGPFDVSLTVGGVAVADRTVAELAPGTRTVVQFTGPACGPGTALQITVDPGHTVVETTAVDDVRTVRCK